MSRRILSTQTFRSFIVALAATTILLLTAAASIAAASFSEYSVPTSNSVPYSIAAGPDGAVWFTEYNTNKIGRFSSGIFAEYAIPSPSSGPTSITVGPDGALWFTESLANKIGRITTGGALSEFPITTTNSIPYAIASGSDGALWFTESAGNKIGRITTAGIITNEYAVPASNSQPQGIVSGSDGALWFVERAANQIGRLTTGGAFAEYTIPTANSGAIRIAAGSDNALWFTESAANQIGRITTSGSITEYVVLTTNSGPIDITAGSVGALWFTENNANKIAQITTAGAITESSIPTANSMPNGIATLSGNVWFTEANGNKIGVLAFSTPSKIFIPHIVRTSSAIACVGAGSYDDTDSHIAYNGNWQSFSGAGPYNNTLHYSDATGESATLVFCGGGVTILYAANTNGGVLNVSIDGVAVGTINEYSASLQWQQQWVSGPQSAGAHTLTLSHAGGARVNIDAIDVSSPPAAPSSVCVWVHYDTDGDGNLTGEPLLRGAGITLKNSSNVIIGSFVSYDTGSRCFSNLAADTYAVTEQDPPAFASSTPNTRSVSVAAGVTETVYFGDSISQPNGMVSDTNRNHLFVVSKNTGWLVAWDEVNNKILTNLNVGSQPWGVGLANDRVFVAENGSKVVAVIDAATLVRVKDINLAPICDGAPTRVAVNPNTNKVYVAIYGYPGRVAVIDAVTLDVQCITLPNPDGDGATGVAVNPSLNQLYVTSRDGQSLLVYDTVTNSRLQSVSLGGQAYFVQAKASTNQVYVTVASDPPDYAHASTLNAYSAATLGVTLTTTAVISNTHDGGAIWVSRANGNLYVAASDDNRLQIIHPVTLAILQSISMTDPSPIAENERIVPGRMYIGNRNVNLITTVSDNLP